MRKVFTAYSLLTALDLGTTLYGINLGLTEANPLFRDLVYRPAEFIMIQLVMLVVAYAVLRTAYKLRKRGKLFNITYRLVSIIYLSRILPDNQ